MGGLRSSLICSLAICITATSSPLAAQDDEDSPYRPGLLGTYSAGASSATRIDEVVAFDWQNAACDERLPVGDFSATWRGRLWARGSGTYRLACYGQGAVTVSVAGKKVIEGEAREPQWLSAEPLELEFDHHPLEITFRKTQPRAQLALFWSGPDFQLEPISARSLFHDRDRSPPVDFERGRQLAAALRCGACHQEDSSSVTPAPALDRLTGNIYERWIVDRLTNHEVQPGRRMPHLAMNRGEATAIAAWLLREPALIVEPKKADSQPTKSNEKSKKADGKSGKKSRDEKPRPSAVEGERLLVTRGCLACHQLGQFGESGLYGGGDLTNLLQKRPPGFLARWLLDPGAINKSHRMPVFSFTADELESLRLWEADQWKKVSTWREDKASNRAALVREGERLIKDFRCESCHVLSRAADELTAASIPSLSAASHWERTCGGELPREKNQPVYRLSPADSAALKAYYSQQRPGARSLSPQAGGRDLLTQLNCLSCHQRDGIDRTTAALPPILQDKLAGVAQSHDDLAPLIPAMTPPALSSVGDKLHDAALADSISRSGPPHRPYLLVQMPKFKLSDDQLASLTAYFTATDRIPVGNALRGVPTAADLSETPTPRLLAAGPRLVTTDGLACTSCHAVGSIEPAKAPLNARGPNLSMMEKRIRREWFDRWCADPARIVPRMEMPSVKIPVRGVLNDNVKDQLAAVWHILNTPSFEPPEPNPVRTLRLSGVPEKNERPIVIHDVFKDGDKTYLYPLVIGLPNRHNILFDLETNRLAAWWLGDTARQRTKGKSWFWEMGGKSLLDSEFAHAEITLEANDKEWVPKRIGQFAARLNRYSITKSIDGHLGGISNDNTGVSIDYQLAFEPIDAAASTPAAEWLVDAKQSFAPYGPDGGVFRLIELSGSGNVHSIRFRLVDGREMRPGNWTFDEGGWKSPRNSVSVSGGDIRERRAESNEKSSEGFSIEYGPENQWKASLFLVYKSRLASDKVIAVPQPEPPLATGGIAIAPGFAAIRLPLPGDIMPIGLSWKAANRLAFCTLKGQLFIANDSDADGLEDRLHCEADGFATPYGLHSFSDSDLISTKAGLVRQAENVASKTLTTDFVAAGWGHTDDYHDWAVGPLPGDSGELFVALPCQQDQRTDAAAEYRGRVVRLIPRKATFDNPRSYEIEIISSGHRFPMGIAKNRDGELFVTDNQGNYNPFNELNHVRKGAHFGFINALEKQNGFVPPPLTPPAINIPHPWTRSVNGICFLDTPEQLAGPKPGPAAPGASLLPAKSIYGPLEGHLIGCEYDTRRLIRMSLQKIGDTYQGAAYPLSIPTEDVEKGLLGPIVCAIKPTTGELYVGEIRDSGWGASNNIGQIVKIKIEPDKLPCGIAEVRATQTGFTIDFIQPVDRIKAADLASYSLESYRRESTPAYGGPDLDRRSERVNAVIISADAKRATLTLPELRPGHVYELKLKNLAPGGEMFHPDEAHYTLNQIP